MSKLSFLGDGKKGNIGEKNGGWETKIETHESEKVERV